jgi:hypothetical protein
MANPRSDQLGSVVVPPEVGIGGAGLADSCDPALTKLLAAFKAFANTKLNAAWVAAKGLVVDGSNVVADTYPHEPTNGVANRTWSGPALFMWRDKERLFQRTQVYDDAECTGTLMFLLPPLDEEWTVKLGPIRVAMRTCLQLAVKHFGDPSYQNGIDILTDAGVESFAFTSAEYAHIPSEVGIDSHHGALIMEWVMREREEFVLEQYERLTQIATDITSKDDAGETTVEQTLFVTNNT